MPYPKPTVTKTSIAHENRYYKIRHDELLFPNGHKGDYWVLEKVDGAGVIAELDGKFCTVSQFRHPTQLVMYEFPCGTTATGNNAETAKRELREETGLIAKDLQYLLTVHLAEGHTNLKTHFYYSKVEQEKGNTSRDKEEYDLQMHWFNAKEIDDMIFTGKITSSQTIAAWLYFRMSPVWTASKAEPGIALS